MDNCLEIIKKLNIIKQDLMTTGGTGTHELIYKSISICHKSDA